MSELWTANWDVPRPFVHPLRTPAGAVLTVDAPDDHPWHHALWSTIKYVNGENFWEEYDEFGLLHTTEVHEDADPRRVTARIEWRRPNADDVALDEVRTIEQHEVDESSYALDWTVQLTPRTDVTLDRTPYTTWGGYGGLTLRGAPDWTDTTLVLADTSGSHEQLRGDRARWCHLQGTAPVGGSSGVAGAALLDHPDNVRHPSPWYASTRGDTYGEGWANFCNAAFLWEEPLEVAAGVALTLRHRVLVHDGEWSAERLDREWSNWTR